MRPEERTFVAIKPDGVKRGLIGRILSRFEDKGFKVVGMKLLQVTTLQIHSLMFQKIKLLKKSN